MILTKDYPIYINPDFSEIIELARSGWDTIRILIYDPRPYVEGGLLIDSPDTSLILGSGYGNTHYSLVTALANHLKKKRTPWCTPIILYRENEIAYFNLEDFGGGQRTRFDRARHSFSTQHRQILRDLIRESDLAI